MWVAPSLGPKPQHPDNEGRNPDGSRPNRRQSERSPSTGERDYWMMPAARSWTVRSCGAVDAVIAVS
jgi:hypothetical protein